MVIRDVFIDYERRGGHVVWGKGQNGPTATIRCIFDGHDDVNPSLTVNLDDHCYPGRWICWSHPRHISGGWNEIANCLLNADINHTNSHRRINRVSGHSPDHYDATYDHENDEYINDVDAIIRRYGRPVNTWRGIDSDTLMLCGVRCVNASSMDFKTMYEEYSAFMRHNMTDVKYDPVVDHYLHDDSMRLSTTLINEFKVLDKRTSEMMRRLYDGRVMIPINDCNTTHGWMTAWDGISPEPPVKYRNPTVRVSELSYNVDVATYIMNHRDRSLDLPRILMICEGPRDAMNATMHGYPAVATLGSTSFSRRRVELIREMKPDVVLLGFDPDGAGDYLTMRVGGVLDDNNIPFLIMNLRRNKDGTKHEDLADLSKDRLESIMDMVTQKMRMK